MPRASRWALGALVGLMLAATAAAGAFLVLLWLVESSGPP